MANLPLFKQKQYEFAAHIRDPDNNPRPDDIEARRMNIYTELFYNNVEDFMANTFPVLRKITSDDRWHAMIRDYFSRHLSHTPLFPEMPREFLKYLENEREMQADDYPFMLELAHYEWVELALHMSDLDEDVSWQQIDPQGNLLEGRPILSPLAWPLQYQYPVHQIDTESLPEQANAQPTYLLVYRDTNDEVHFMELNPVTAHLLQLLNDESSLSGQQLLQSIAEQLQHPNPQAVIEGGQQILEDLRQRGVILGIAK